MAKAKSLFFCKECGFESSKWLGQCPGCKAWDSFVEEPYAKKQSVSSSRLKSFHSGEKKEPQTLGQVVLKEEERIPTLIGELDRVLGGGIVAGSLVLVGGDPGIGKSTLLLQMCRELVQKQHRVLYISGEESLRQIKMRAQRLGFTDNELLLFCETNLDVIEEAIQRTSPEIVIIDSIQTMYREDISSAPGSVSQVRETTSTLLHIAKSTGVTIFIVGHVTKEGMVAGPRVLEHMVDTVLYFEGENQNSYRILRAVKNRFGSTNEIGVFEMRGTGLVEVKNPSEYMLKGRPEGASGSVVSCSMEGTRPLLLEVQALVCRTNFNLPRRTTAGTDFNRVNLLMAVVEKRLGMSFSECDAYVNVAGGMKVNEPALDLAIVMALISSYRNRAVDSAALVFGEVGLTGEIRAVSMAELRVMEAAKMGYQSCILPKSNAEKLPKGIGMKIFGVSNIKEISNYS
jgi:DNA repair protein RadA/Sms